MFKFVFCTGSVKRREKSNNIQSHMSGIIQKKWKCLESFIDKKSSNLQQYTAIHTIIKIYFGRLCQRPKQKVTWNSHKEQRKRLPSFISEKWNDKEEWHLCNITQGKGLLKFWTLKWDYSGRVESLPVIFLTRSEWSTRFRCVTSTVKETNLSNFSRIGSVNTQRYSTFIQNLLTTHLFLWE